MDFSLSKFNNCFEIANVYTCMTPATELVVYFENPSIGIDICGNKLCQMLEEVLFAVDVMNSYGHRYVSYLKDSFGSRFR